MDQEYFDEYFPEVLKEIKEKFVAEKESGDIDIAYIDVATEACENHRLTINQAAQMLQKVAKLYTEIKEN